MIEVLQSESEFNDVVHLPTADAVRRLEAARSPAELIEEAGLLSEPDG